jgi:transcriptional regulator with XRE-family HTH domain
MGGRALLAWNLRRLRTAKGVSQERLAFDAAVARAWVSKIEREAGSASVDLLERLAVVLEVPIAALFEQPKDTDVRAEPLKSGRKASK